MMDLDGFSKMDLVKGRSLFVQTFLLSIVKSIHLKISVECALVQNPGFTTDFVTNYRYFIMTDHNERLC